MGAEIGATTSIFPFDESMDALPARRPSARSWPTWPTSTRHLLRADAEVAADPGEVLRPRDRDRPLHARAAPRRAAHAGPGAARLARWPRPCSNEGYPDEISVALIGSCTNSSYEDIARVADVVRQAQAHGMRAGRRAVHGHARVGAGPGHDRARRPDGRARGVRRHGAGQRLRPVHRPVEARRDRAGRARTRSSPPSTATSRGATTATRTRWPSSAAPRSSPPTRSPGRLSFNPLTDAIKTADGEAFKLDPPQPAPDLPPTGSCATPRATSRRRRTAAASRSRSTPDSERLQLLEPFAAWDGEDFDGAAAAAQGQGQVHDRPHLAGRPVAALPRPPGQHLGQHVHRRDQRLHRRGRARRCNLLDGERGRAGARGGPGLQGGRDCAGSSSATRTTARARAASTPPCRPACSAPPR